MSLPIFPQSAQGGASHAPANAAFSPNALLEGFLVGPENRLAELAVYFANRGVPVFSRPLGDRAIDPIVEVNRQPSRADVEILFRAAIDRSPNRSDLSNDPYLLYDQERFNRIAISENNPTILGYRPLEDAAFLSPLVFYGPSGSGKTRLVEGICQYRRLLNPRKTLYYLSGLEFSQALNDAIRKDQTELFFQLFTQASVVAIENADILAAREAAQIEFLPMLDAALKARKLVIMTFSKLPSSIPGFRPNLAARLSAGLLVPVNLPTKETKQIVVERVVKKLGLRMDYETRLLCVERLPSSIGGICAALTQIAREFSAFRTPVSFENVQNYLERRNPAPEWTLDRIVKTVAKYFAVSVVEMRGKKRLKTLVLARKYVAFLARKLTKATLQEIGDQFSSRDHSTIVYSVREVEELIQVDEQAKHDMHEIVKALGAENVLKI